MMKFFMVGGFMMFMPFISLSLTVYVNMCFLLSGLIMCCVLSKGMEGFWVLLCFYFGFDKYSLFMILLSGWIMGLMFMSLHEDIGNISEFELKKKLFVFLVMLNILFMFFGAYNFLWMYFFFELSLIPTFFMVLLWGNNWERVEASFYLFLYMMFISFPLLVYVMKFYKYNSSLEMGVANILDFNKFANILGSWDYLVIFGAFFIKLPVYLFHIWLPKAHVEAPVYGSMLLAAILLKLGGYGLLRLILMFIWKSSEYTSLVVGLGMVGVLYVGILCLVQVDMKSLVAYSSVVHMNLMMCVLYTLVKMGVSGGFIIMISHGLCSSGLFYMVNIYYKRSLSRLLILNKGGISLMPSMMVWWFMLCMSNFSFPLSLNFVGEIFMIMVLLSWDWGVMVFLFVICFFSGAYSLYLFSFVYHGKLNMGGWMFNSGMFIEYLEVYLHYVPLLLMLFSLYMYL